MKCCILQKQGKQRSSKHTVSFSIQLCFGCHKTCSFRE